MTLMVLARPRTVLVHEYITGGGLAGQELPASLAAEGRAMRRALVEDFAALHAIEVVMTLDARFPDEPGPWRVVRVGPGEERATFERLAAEVEAVALIAPETDGVLLERARTIERVGGRSLGSSPEAIALTADKCALGTLWQERSLPTPPGRRVRPSESLPHDFPYPAVLKPIDGAGSASTFYVASPAGLPPEVGQELPEGLLQPFMGGSPLSAAFLIVPVEKPVTESAYLIGIGRQWIRIREGRFTYQGGCVPYPYRVPVGLIRRALRVVRGLAGWVGVDFLWDEAREELTLLEINPRLTTSYVGWRRFFTRGDLAGRWLLALEHPHLLLRGQVMGTRLPNAEPVSFHADGSLVSAFPPESDDCEP